MKKKYVILFALMLLFSCHKESDLDGLISNGVLDKNLDFKQPSLNNLPGGSGSCYDEFLVSNFNYMRQASAVPNNLQNLYFAASMRANEDALNACGTVIFANDRNIRNLEAIAPMPPGSSPFTVYSDPTDVLNILKGTYYFGTTKNYFEILIEALDYVNAANINFNYAENPNYSYIEKMIAISKAIHDLGYDGMFLSQVYHGGYDPTESYIYHAIEILSGKYAMTSDFYNSFIAKNPNEYISYPVVKYYNGITLMQADNYVLSGSTGPFNPISLNIIINPNTTVMHYVTNLSSLIGPIGPTPSNPTGPGPIFANQTSVYCQFGTQEFFTDAIMTTHIPNGYYYLPYNHPSEFQRNNYMIEIENGQIKTVLGI